RVAGDCLLDLDGRYILASADDDVLGPIAQFDVSVGMHHAEIAGMEPSPAEGLDCRLVIIEVATHGVIATHDDFAHGHAIGWHVDHHLIDNARIVSDEITDALASLDAAALVGG